MTHAVCFNCGAMKFGVLLACKACGRMPSSDLDYAYSFGLSDHFIDLDTLREISVSMQAGAPRPLFRSDDEKHLLEQFGLNARKAARTGAR